jgi:hypothetical protein
MTTRTPLSALYVIWLCPKIMAQPASPMKFSERIDVFFADDASASLGGNRFHGIDTSSLRNAHAFLAPGAVVLDSGSHRCPPMPPLALKREPLFC